MTYNEKRKINKTIIESKDIIMNLVRELASDDSTYKSFKCLLDANELLSKAMYEINHME